MEKGIVIFSHGKESTPAGAKISALAEVARERGFAAESLDFADLPNPDGRVQRLVERCVREKRPLVLAGSSMGGYVATVASNAVKPVGLFLMAPAFYLSGYAEQSPVPRAQKTVIVHGWNDDVIPAEHSVRFAGRHRAELFLVDGDHFLSSQLPFLVELFGLFLDRLNDSPRYSLGVVRALHRGHRAAGM
ncbi:YqiA/YcfP family alpha/beta fold hydrolase [Geobacter pickeringii]|uniref:YqiA/YcfP family alpha/beta fold hydrolase n=1 Tax=Geobacter pickeringii TaxID=345632 RepID=UPI0011851B41|nr:YqiA/YcfP family alpha/beta fold hydrolase [Geobacter pickeringii]